MKKKIIPIFVPHKGCPHDCIFCNQKKITGISTDVTEETARKVIEECLEYIDRDASIEIAFFGGSFTAIDIDIQRSLLSVAKEYIDSGDVDYIRLSTRPDCIDKEILDMLKEYGVRIIELGVQSLDEQVLTESIRGHNTDIVYESAKAIKDAGFELGLQMMLGLPGDTEEKCLYTAREFVKMDPSCVRIYPTLVVQDTGLETLLSQNKYTPFTLDKSIDIVKKLLLIYYEHNINVIRVGLQATDDIQMGEAVVDGPYHPAFRELVESEMIKDYIENEIVSKYETMDQIIIETNTKNISKIIGNKRSNKNYFLDKFKIKIKVQEQTMDVDKFKINIDSKESIEVSIDDIYSRLSSIYNI